MKRHYLGLDGLRGVAAITVVAHHLENEVHRGVGYFSAGYLSVDFFFALSGFVIAAAYEERFAAGMGLKAFLSVRLQRLYPMIFLGAWIALACALAIPNLGGSLPLMFVSTLLLIPVLGGSGVLFALNAAYWSLLFELGANIAHVLLFRWSRTWLLALGVVLSALVAIPVARLFGHFGGGWSTHNWWAAIVRVAFSYALGVLAWRLHKAGKLPTFTAPFPVMAALFVGAVAAASQLHAWWAELVAVILVFPLLLIAGVNATEGRFTATVAVLGAVSYPLYAIHSPPVHIWGLYAPHNLFSALLMMAAMVGAAFVCDRWYDGPVRRRVGKLLRRTPAPTPAIAEAGTSPASPPKTRNG